MKKKEKRKSAEKVPIHRSHDLDSVGTPPSLTASLQLLIAISDVSREAGSRYL